MSKAESLGMWLIGAIVIILLLVITWLWRIAAQRAHAAMVSNQLLNLSQQRLQYALEGSNLVLWDFDITRGEIYFSDQLAMILGSEKPAARIMQSTEFHSLIHPEDLAAAKSSLMAVINGEASSYRSSYRICAHDGNWKWLSSYGKVVEKDKDGKVLRLTGTLADNTELRRNQEELRLMARAMEESVDGILISDASLPDMPIIYCNSAFEYMTGYSSDEVIGRNCRFLQGDDRDQQVLEMIRSAQSHNNATSALLRNYRKDGSLFWNELSISPVHDENGKLTHYIGIAKDVTARIKAEEAVHRENEFSSAAINALPGAFYVLNKQGHVMRFNKNVAQITGYSDSELTEMSPEELYVEEDRDLIKSKIAECFEQGQAMCEARLQTKSGKQLSFYLQAKLYVLDGEECLVGTGTDISEIKRIQQALIQSESILNTIVEHIPAMVFLKRASDLSYVLVNKAGEEILEYSREDIVGKTDRVLFASEEAELMESVDREVLASRQVRILPEAQFHSRSGWQRHLYTVKTALLDEQGQPSHLLGLAIDVTERKRAETKLRTSEKRLMEAQRIAQLGHWSFDIKKDELAWSDEVYRIFGQDKSRYLPSYDKFFAVVHPDDVELLKQSEQRAITDKLSHSLDHRIVRPDGSIRWVHEEAKITFSEHGEPLLLVGTVQDITTRKLFEQAVQYSEARQRTILETAVDGIIMINDRGEIDSVNPAAEKMFGYDASELIGSNVSMLMPDPHRSSHDEYLRRYQSTGKAHIIGIGREVVGKRRDGTTFQMELAVSEIKLGDKRMFTGFVRDITQRKQAESELLIAKQAAEQASRAKSEFLANMSHELRTPMNAILGFAQLLDAAEPPLAEDQQQDVREILGAGQHLLGLINELLDLARIEAGQMDICIEPVSIQTALNECVQMIDPLLLKHDIHLRINLGDAQDNCIMADRIRLRQVLLNLLSNAVKYNVEGGTVTVTSHLQQNGYIQIVVEDTGIGIAPEKHKELFNSFARLGAEKTNTEGTGIGLAITRKLIQLMQGEMGVTSEPGTGSRFWIELPAANAQTIELGTTEETAAPVVPVPGGLNGKHTILYIEDNPANLRFMSHLLARQPSFKLITATEPAQGLLLAQAQRPDVILLDINLPGMDGYEVFGKLQAEASTQDIPVIAVSANAMPEEIQRALDAGFKDYCTKPIEINKFQQTLNTILIST